MGHYWSEMQWEEPVPIGKDCLPLQVSATHERSSEAAEWRDTLEAMRNSTSTSSAHEVRVVDPTTGGMKGQKPEQYSLIPTEALAEVARVYAMGAEKYDRNNWRLGYDWHLSYDAFQRHANAFWSGETNDPESGLHHMAHAIFHAMTLITFTKLGLGTDDRA